MEIAKAELAKIRAKADKDKAAMQAVAQAELNTLREKVAAAQAEVKAELDIIRAKADEDNAIMQAAQTKPQLTTLCGIKPDQTEAVFSGLGWGDAILLAFDLSRNANLVKLKFVHL